MKKKVISVLCMLVICFVLIAATTEDASAMRPYRCYIYNCKTSVVVRANPSKSAAIKGRVPYGKFVINTYGAGKKNGYFKMAYNNISGWVPAKYCTWSDCAGTLCAFRCKTKRALKIRKYKSSSSKVIVKMKKSAVVFTYKMISSTNQKWVRVNYKGKKGYVLKKYLRSADYDTYENKY